MNKLRKYIAPFILVFALFAINGAEFFHHHDADTFTKENNCQACLIYKTLHSVSPEKSEIHLDLNVSFEKISIAENAFCEQDYSDESKGRSPPLASHI